MPPSSAYGSFAYAYDKALGERFFRSVRRLLVALLERYPSGDKTHLDLACGTGLVMRFFAQQGWTTSGLDASLSMLQLARRRAMRLVAADLRALPVRATFARITCLYDSLNHLKDRKELVSAFQAIREVMHERSLLMFDVNHPDIYPAVWGMREPFVAEGRDYHLEIATSFRAGERLGIARVSGWAVLPNGVRTEIRERHEQRAYSEGEIVDALMESGIAPVEVIDFDPYDESETISSQSVKLFFVCRMDA